MSERKSSVEVNEKLTLQVAHLARLKLTEPEVTTYTSQLKNILKYVEQLQEVDVSFTEPLTYPLEAATPLREDKIKEGQVDTEGKPKVLSSASDVLFGGYKVPPIL